MAVDEHVFDLIPGYTLEILNDEELLAVARHLPRCLACQQELRAYTQTAVLAAASVPVMSTAPDLKVKVLGRVESISHQIAQHAGPAVVQEPARERRGWWDKTQGSLRAFFGSRWGMAIGLAALLVILLLGASNLYLSQQVDELQARLPAENVQIVRLEGTDQAPNSMGYVMVFRDEVNGSLTVEDVPVLPPDQQYQIWLIKDGVRTSGGVFSVNEDGYSTLQITSDQPLDTYDAFGITIEPAGGSPGPTGPRVMGGSL